MWKADAAAHAVPEEIRRIDDPAAGLRGVIVLHSTRLGPAAGGCRMWTYTSDADAALDALRLAEGMTYKNALAGLPFGGAKAVLHAPPPGTVRGRLFRAFGDVVDGLEGRYITAQDVGTGVEDMLAVRDGTRHVAGIRPAGGRAADPSAWTALGVLLAMRHAVQRRLGRSLSGTTVALQGAGNVGAALCRLLVDDGARVLLADAAPSRAKAVAKGMPGVRIVSAAAISHVEADVFAPCALGAVLDGRTVAALKAKVVVGAANNQLASEADGRRLAERGILYAPDYVVNAGGMIAVAAEWLGPDFGKLADHVGHIPARLSQILDRAEREGRPPSLVADACARELVEAGSPDRLLDAAA